MIDLNRLKEVAKSVDHWARMAGFTSQQESVLSATQLSEIAALINSAQQRIAELEDFNRVDMKLKRVIANRLEAAEAEIARRDQAAGEPVGYVRAGESKVLDRLKQHQAVEIAIFRTRSFSDDMPLFAAQPAALPPEYALTVDFNDYHLGWNSCLNAAKALGAQPEKVVVLPRDHMRDRDFKYFEESKVIASLDSAGVKWKWAE